MKYPVPARPLLLTLSLLAVLPLYAAENTDADPAVVTSPAAAQPARDSAAAPTALGAVPPAPSTTPPPAPRATPGAAPGTTSPGPAATPSAARGSNDRIELEATQITGNAELPRVMYVVPWKRAELGDLSGRPARSLLDEVLTPVDRDVFRRQNRYYEALRPDAAQAAPGEK